MISSSTYITYSHATFHGRKKFNANMLLERARTEALFRGRIGREGGHLFPKSFLKLFSPISHYGIPS